jgi:hypothetical protein
METDSVAISYFAASAWRLSELAGKRNVGFDVPLPPL